jgi:hypothetical protein
MEISTSMYLCTNAEALVWSSWDSTSKIAGGSTLQRNILETPEGQSQGLLPGGGKLKTQETEEPALSLKPLRNKARCKLT